MPLDFVKSKCGNKMLQHCGYVYRKERLGKDKAIWRCIENRRSKCKARCHTVDKDIQAILGVHNHAPDVAKTEAMQYIASLKENARSSEASIEQLLEAASHHISGPAAAQLPSTEAMKKTIRRARLKCRRPPASPSSLTDLELPLEDYKPTITIEQFLLHDSGAESSMNEIILTPKREISPKVELDDDFSPKDMESMSPSADDAFPVFDSALHGTGPPLEYVMSSRGIPKLIDNGSMFLRYRENGDKISWKCDLSASHHCKAKVYTQGEAIVKRMGDHSHAGNAAKIEIAKMMEQIYQRAQSTQDGTSKIVNDAISMLSPASISQLPNVNSIKRLIHRNRSKKELLPPAPQSSLDFVLQDEYQCTESGAEFLKADISVGDVHRYLIYSTDQMLETLARCDTWFVDGVFKLSLPIFTKIFVILGVFADTVIPLVYVMMTAAREEVFSSIFSKLLELEPTLNPRTVFGDFEVVSYGEISKAFPTASQHGSFFQFCQIYYSSVQAFELQPKYESDAEFALKMRLLPALAFVGLDDVTDAFENLALYSQFPPEAIPLLDHFEDSWIGRPVCGKARRATLFPVRFWNCADVLHMNIIKMNSIFEAWHRYFNSQLTSNLGVNIWRFIKFLKTDQAKNEATLIQIVDEGKSVVGKWQPKMSFKKLENVINTSDKSNTLEFMQSIASCLFF